MEHPSVAAVYSAQLKERSATASEKVPSHVQIPSHLTGRSYSAADFAKFLSDEIRRLDGARMSAGLLESRHNVWCSKNCVEPPSAAAFRRHMSDFGGRRKKSVGRIFYLGIEPKK